MLNIILNIIGIALVIYSLLSILRMYKKKEEERLKEEVDDLTRENNMANKEDTFINLINDKIDSTSRAQKNAYIKNLDLKDEFVKNNKTLTKESINNVKDNSLIRDNRHQIHIDDMNPIHRKVMELKYIGLTNEEISKKTNRSIREIEIILKILEK